MATADGPDVESVGLKTKTKTEIMADQGFTKLPDSDPTMAAAAATAGGSAVSAVAKKRGIDGPVQTHSYPDGVGFDDLYQDMASSQLTTSGTLMVSGIDPSSVSTSGQKGGSGFGCQLFLTFYRCTFQCMHQISTGPSATRAFTQTFALSLACLVSF
jgi:hypothetical protein